MNSDKWFFDKVRLVNSPSRKYGFDEDTELSCLQKTANFIQDLGRELALPLLCMNTAVLFTQRFYLFHPLTVFEKYSFGASALFLAAKVEEHPRKVEDVFKASKKLGLFTDDKSDAENIYGLIVNENVLLQTLGFEVHVEHPHQYVLKINDYVKASKNLARIAYILATYCLHLTRMCLTYKPKIIACVCIFMASRMVGCEISVPNEGKTWYQAIENSVNITLLETLSVEFLMILRKCPHKFKNRTLKNSVKKWAIDASRTSSFLSGSPVICNSGQSVDGISSSLQEEFLLINSSLICESQALHESTSKCAPVDLTLNQAKDANYYPKTNREDISAHKREDANRHNNSSSALPYPLNKTDSLLVKKHVINESCDVSSRSILKQGSTKANASNLILLSSGQCLAKSNVLQERQFQNCPRTPGSDLPVNHEPVAAYEFISENSSHDLDYFVSNDQATPFIRRQVSYDANLPTSGSDIDGSLSYQYLDPQSLNCPYSLDPVPSEVIVITQQSTHLDVSDQFVNATHIKTPGSYDNITRSESYSHQANFSSSSHRRNLSPLMANNQSSEKMSLKISIPKSKIWGENQPPISFAWHSPELKSNPKRLKHN